MGSEMCIRDRKEGFGWCICESSGEIPLPVVNTGVVSSAQGAKDEVDNICNGNGGRLKAIGIDAPLFWDPQGDRQVDQHLRKVISQSGGTSSTIMAVNSLPGACLIQGMMVAMLYRNDNRKLPITEAHPKAMLYAMGLSPTLTTLANAQSNQQVLFQLPKEIADNEHTRDAALAALAAWAILHNQQGWSDLYAQFGGGALTPLSPPLHYYFPS